MYTEKVLRNLMDRIKSQREGWMTAHSMADVGDGSQHPPPASSAQQPRMSSVMFPGGINAKFQHFTNDENYLIQYNIMRKN